MSNFTDFDSDYYLAPKDGNYGINTPDEYFQRNPGLSFPNHSRMDCPISFRENAKTLATNVFRGFSSDRLFAELRARDW